MFVPVGCKYFFGSGVFYQSLDFCFYVGTAVGTFCLGTFWPTDLWTFWSYTRGRFGLGTFWLDTQNSMRSIVTLKLKLTLTLILTDTESAVLTLMLGYRPGGELPWQTPSHTHHCGAQYFFFGFCIVVLLMHLQQQQQSCLWNKLPASFRRVSLKHNGTDGTVKMASLWQTGQADRTLKTARLPVPSGTGRRDNGEGPFFFPLSTWQMGHRKTARTESQTVEIVCRT